MSINLYIHTKTSRASVKLFLSSLSMYCCTSTQRSFEIDFSLGKSVSEYSNYQKEKECQRKTNAAVERSFSVIYQCLKTSYYAFCARNKQYLKEVLLIKI